MNGLYVPYIYIHTIYIGCNPLTMPGTQDAPHDQCCRHWLVAPVLGVGRSSCWCGDFAGNCWLNEEEMRLFQWDKWRKMEKHAEKWYFHPGRMVR